MTQAKALNRPSVFLFSLGPLATIALLYIAWKRQYPIGLSFTPGLHVFGFFLELVWFAPLAITIATAQFALSWQHLRAKTPHYNRQTYLALFIIICLIAPLAVIPIMESGLRAGRTEAYQRVNFNRLVKGCRDLRLDSFATGMDTTSIITFPADDKYHLLPQEILDLHPTSVYAGKRGVVLQMDGGGIAGHEGMFVPLAPVGPDIQALESSGNLSRLNEDPLVFRYAMDSDFLPYK